MVTKTTPKTPSERAVVALNALTHGATAKTLFLEDDNPDEFFALLEDAFEHHQPTCRQDSDLVTDTVLARWFLSRRQRIYGAYEAALYKRKPDGFYWIPCDVEDLEVFERYVTTASRALTRAFNNVRHIRRDAQSEYRWQTHHEFQKERFALQRERFELAKQKEERLTARRDAKELKQQKKEEEQIKNTTPALALNNDFPPISALVAAGLTSAPSKFQQTLYIGFEDDDVTTVVYEVTPSNEKIREAISDEDQVTRVYNFVGGVPPEYKHLITPDAITWGASTSVTKIYSAEEWTSLADNE
jgi:hypothetical protein